MGSQTRPSVVTETVREVYMREGVWLVRTCPRGCVCSLCESAREERARWARARQIIDREEWDR